MSKDIYNENDSRIPKEVLELLETRNSIFLRQKGKLKECIEGCCTCLGCCCEFANRYDIEDPSNDQVLLKMKEESSCCMRSMCGSNAPFDMEFELADGTDLNLKFHKPYRCTDARCCCPFGWFYWCGCTQEMEIIANGENIGKVEEQYGTWCGTGKWSAFDDEGVERMKLETDCCDFCKCCSCSDINFDLYDREDREIGTLSKKWLCPSMCTYCCGCCNASETQMDHFQVDFKEDLKVSAEDKLYGIALCVLMKYVYFEEANDLDDPHDGK